MNKLIVLFTAISMLIIAGCSGQEIALNDSFSEIENVELAITDKFGDTKLFRGDYVSPYEQETIELQKEFLLDYKAKLDARDEEVVEDLLNAVDRNYEYGNLHEYLLVNRARNAASLGSIVVYFQGDELGFIAEEIIELESEIISEYVCEQYPSYCGQSADFVIHGDPIDEELLESQYNEFITYLYDPIMDGDEELLEELYYEVDRSIESNGPIGLAELYLFPYDGPAEDLQLMSLIAADEMEEVNEEITKLVNIYVCENYEEYCPGVERIDSGSFTNTLREGESYEVIMNSKYYTVELLVADEGTDSSDPEAVIRVNGFVRVLDEEDVKLFDDVYVSVEDISDVAGDSFRNNMADVTIYTEDPREVEEKELELADISESVNAFINGGATFLDFSREYDNPVVIIQPTTLSSNYSIIPEINYVSNSGFEVELNTWDYLDVDLNVTVEISYFVIESGIYEIDGKTIYAGTSLVNDVFSKVKYSNLELEEAPTVLVQTQSNIDEMSTIARVKSVNENGFRAKIQAQESYKNLSANETLGFVIFESGMYETSEFEAEVRDKYTFDSKTTVINPDEFPRSSMHRFVQMQTTNGGDPVVIDSYLDNNGEEIVFFQSEEQSNDKEISHVSETVAIVYIR